MARFQLNRMSSYANVTVLLSMLSCKPCKPSYHCHCLVIHVYYKYCILFLINQFFGHTNLVYIGRRGWFSEMALANHVSVPKPFGSGEAHEWLQKFEICSRANKWTEEVKALKLPTLLEGEAIAVWLELSEDEQADYSVVKDKQVSSPRFCLS